jgi:hypothetical protein
LEKSPRRLEKKLKANSKILMKTCKLRSRRKTQKKEMITMMEMMRINLILSMYGFKVLKL